MGLTINEAEGWVIDIGQVIRPSPFLLVRGRGLEPYWQYGAKLCLTSTYISYFDKLMLFRALYV